jgi:hypothetical protein
MTLNGGIDYKLKSYDERQMSVYKNFNFGLSHLNPNPAYKKSHTLTIRQVYEIVKKGGGIHKVEDIKQKISYIQTHTKVEAEFIKKSLPSFTASAEFVDIKSKNADKTYTQIMCFDFDKLTYERTGQALAELQSWEFAMLVFKSPSGNGIKLFVCVDSKEQQHELIYKCLEQFFKDKFDLLADMQCIDYSRLCFFSHDSNAYFNAEAPFIATNELVHKYQDIVKEHSSNSLDVDNIDYGAINTSSTKAIFYGLIDQLLLSEVSWMDGKRNRLLIEICQLKRWGVTYQECLTELMLFINGRFTKDYNAATLPKKLEYNWKHYFNSYEVSDPGKTNGLLINDYLAEQKVYIISELLAKRLIFIDAPTGSGKTTLIKQLAEELNFKTDILMPTTALVDQQTDIVGITGNKALTIEQVNAKVLACCYNSISKIQDRSSEMLVIDEAHSMVSDYGFKSKTIQDIQLHLNRYDYIIYISGSMLTLKGYYSTENLLRFEKKNCFDYEYQLIELEDGVTDKDYFISSIDSTKLNVFYQNDKNVLDSLYAYLVAEGYKVAYVSRDKKDRDEYIGIVKNSSLRGYDVLLTTCVIQAGVNITDCDREAVVTFGKRTDLIDYIQFTARFRKSKPSVRIIHSKRLGQLRLNDNSALLDRIVIEKQMLEKAKEKNHSRTIDFNYLEAKRIVKGYDLVFEDYDGNYIVDTFRLLYESYQTLCYNIRCNVRVLKHFLNQYHFTEVQADSLVVDEAKTKKLKRACRNNSQEIKQRRDRVISSILSGNHTFHNTTDKVTREVENRYMFLSEFLSDGDIKKDMSLLTSRASFERYQCRVTYILAEADIKAKKQVADKVLLDFKRLEYIEKQIKVNHTYTGLQLRQMLQKTGFEIGGSNYINNSLGILYTIERSRNGLNYTIMRRITRSELITRKCFVETVAEECLF